MIQKNLKRVKNLKNHPKEKQVRKKRVNKKGDIGKCDRIM